MEPAPAGGRGSAVSCRVERIHAAQLDWPGSITYDWRVFSCACEGSSYQESMHSLITGWAEFAGRHQVDRLLAGGTSRTPTCSGELSRGGAQMRAAASR